MRKRRGYVKSGITLEQIVAAADCSICLHIWSNSEDEEFKISLEDPRAASLLDDETLKKEVRKMSTSSFNSGLHIWAGNWSDEDIKEAEDDDIL